MSQEILKVLYKNKSGRLLCSSELLNIVREHFSVENPVYISRKFQPRVYKITPLGSFDVGLWYEIKTFIDSMNLNLKIEESSEFLKVFQPKLSDITSFQPIDGFTYYDYQEDSLQECISNGRGIVLLPTSAGKELIIAGLCKSVLQNKPNAKILIIVPNTGLLHQVYHGFMEKYNLPIITRWGDDLEPEPDKNVIIANAQILVRDIKRALKKIKNVDMVIVDEVHTLGDNKNKLNKVIANIITSNKFGLTGTLPDKMLNAWNIIGKIGPILYEKTSYDIRKQGTATDVKVKVIYCKHQNIPHFYHIDKPTDKYSQESDWLYTNKKRNEIIYKIVKNVDKNVLVLVERIAQGELYYKNLKNLNKKVFFIQGSTEVEDRQKIQQLMELHNDVVVIAMSRIFSTGINVKNIHYIIFPIIGKDKIKIMQSIGRSMRLNNNKNIAIIFDIGDNTEYSLLHLKERLYLYQKEKIDFTIKKLSL